MKSLRYLTVFPEHLVSLEPAGEEKDRITTPGFMLVPGLAFDKKRKSSWIRRWILR